VILLIDHDAQPVAEKHGGAAPHRVLRIQTRELLAHQMPLVQEQPVAGRELVHPDEDVITQTGCRVHGVSNRGQNPQPLPVTRTCPKGKAVKVPGEPDPGGQHDPRVLPGGIQPVDPAVGQEREIQAHSSTLI
jgi:hypothetical protein